MFCCYFLITFRASIEKDCHESWYELSEDERKSCAEYRGISPMYFQRLAIVGTVCTAIAILLTVILNFSIGLKIKWTDFYFRCIIGGWYSRHINTSKRRQQQSRQGRITLPRMAVQQWWLIMQVRPRRRPTRDPPILQCSNPALHIHMSNSINCISLLFAHTEYWRNRSWDFYWFF